MKTTEFKSWFLRRYGSGEKRPYGVQQQAAADLAVSIATLRHYLHGTHPIGKQTARIVELLDENARLEGRSFTS